jgi:hypothetical protein
MRVMSADDPLTTIDRALDDIGVGALRAGRGAWRVDVPCVDRRSITVGLAADERTLRMQAFMMRAPDRRHEEVHRRLLRKNLDMRATGPWRFAIDDDGDVYLVADVPLAALDAAALDGLLGALSALVDATWAGMVRTGFVVPENPGANGRPRREPG